MKPIEICFEISISFIKAQRHSVDTCHFNLSRTNFVVKLDNGLVQMHKKVRKLIK